jgi:hypothetical protein
VNEVHSQQRGALPEAASVSMIQDVSYVELPLDENANNVKLKSYNANVIQAKVIPFADHHSKTLKDQPKEQI